MKEKDVHNLEEYILGGEEKISSYAMRKCETATRLRRRNMVDAFENS
jgi:hypothetical protein